MCQARFNRLADRDKCLDHMRLVLQNLIVVAAASLAGCSMEGSAIAETRTKLVGTWLEVSESASLNAKHLLSLKSDGKFTDEITVSTSEKSIEKRALAGEWSYDGLNLKRRYLQENGRQFSGGNIRYATFPLKSVTQFELVVEDNIQKRSARYRRIE